VCVPSQSHQRVITAHAWQFFFTRHDFAACAACMHCGRSAACPCAERQGVSCPCAASLFERLERSAPSPEPRVTCVGTAATAGQACAAPAQRSRPQPPMPSVLCACRDGGTVGRRGGGCCCRGCGPCVRCALHSALNIRSGAGPKPRQQHLPSAAVHSACKSLLRCIIWCGVHMEPTSFFRLPDGVVWWC
jgi:hypothetical protein